MSIAQRKKRFIARLTAGASVATAAKAAGMSRGGVYLWRDNLKFKIEWDEAVAIGLDLLEDVARKRAVDGSDKLLEMYLKCRRPEVWNPQYQLLQQQLDLANKPLATVDLKLTLYDALTRVQNLGLPPPEIEYDFDDDDKKQ
jgi:hypothetical protein